MAARSPARAYQREATRLAKAELHVVGKVIHRDAGLKLGPFSVRFSAQDYEFDIPASPQTPFTEVLDAAAVGQHLGEMPLAEAPRQPPRPVKAAANYAATASDTEDILPGVCIAKA